MGKITKLYRADGYTSDGFFLIRTSLENSYLKRIKSEDRQPACKRLVEQSFNNLNQPLALATGIKFELNGLKCSKLISFDGKFEITINNYFLYFFKGLGKLSFSGAGSHYPVIVRNSVDEFLGLIMPIRINI